MTKRDIEFAEFRGATTATLSGLRSRMDRLESRFDQIRQTVDNVQVRLDALNRNPYFNGRNSKLKHPATMGGVGAALGLLAGELLQRLPGLLEQIERLLK